MPVQDLRSMMGQYRPANMSATRVSSMPAMSYTPSRSMTTSRVMNGIPTSGMRQGSIISNTATQSTPSTSSSTQMNIGTSNRPMFGDTYSINKRAKKKKTKEPLCDCGKPISQCECEGHDHASKKSSKSHGKSLKKSLPLKHRNKYF